MLSRWQIVKYISVGGFVITWITFFSWLNLTSESSSTPSEVAVDPIQKTCIDYRNQRDELDSSFNAKANEGETRIAFEFREKVLALLGKGYLSKSDELLARNYLSFSFVDEKSDSSYSFSNYLNDREDFESIIDNLLARGLFSLEYSEEIKAIGIEVHKLYLESQALLRDHPQCFKLDIELYGYLETATSKSKSNAGGFEDDNSWVRARSVTRLVDSLLTFTVSVPPKQ